MATTPEGKIQKEIIDYLRKKGHWVLRHNVQGQYDQRTGRYRHSTSTLGESDLQVFAKGILDPIWMEVKTKKGKLSPSQVLFKKMAEDWGHEYVVVRSVDDCIELGL